MSHLNKQDFFYKSLGNKQMTKVMVDHYIPIQNGTDLVLTMCHLGQVTYLLSMTHSPHLQNSSNNITHPLGGVVRIKLVNADKGLRIMLPTL